MEDAKQLIQQAFEQAKASGKPDWHRMTTAVLKNRLLSLTGNAFNEAAYGAPTFSNFVATHDDLVYIDILQWSNCGRLYRKQLHPATSTRHRIAPGFAATYG